MCVGSRSEADEGRERDAGTGSADAAVAVSEEDWRGGFDRAVLSDISIHSVAFKLNVELTLQTTRPHLLHPPTISLAQSPTFPVLDPGASLPDSTKYQSAALARYLKVCSGSSSTSSFSQ
jgi:hypothetical protein